MQFLESFPPCFQSISHSFLFIYFLNIVSELSETSIATSTKSSPIKFKHSLFVKLNHENHLLWRQQVIAAVRRHNLMDLLESSFKPQKFLNTQDEEAGAINAEFTA